MKKQISIVVGDFHKEIAEEMIEFAQDELKSAGITDVSVVRVAGAYEAPLVTDVLLERSDIDAVIVLGYVERGETLDGEIMGHVVNRKLVELSVKYRKPVGIGIIGPGATNEQAQVRKESKSRGAAKAVLRNLSVLEELST